MRRMPRQDIERRREATQSVTGTPVRAPVVVGGHIQGEDKGDVITGGSRGLGLVLARQLAAEGARITLIARDENELRRAADDIRDRHPSADVLIVPADVGRA